MCATARNGYFGGADPLCALSPETLDSAPLQSLIARLAISSGCVQRRGRVFVPRGIGSGAKTPRSGLLPRPVARLGRTSHLTCDLAPRDALYAKPRNPGTVHDAARPSERLSLGACVPQPSRRQGPSLAFHEHSDRPFAEKLFGWVGMRTDRPGPIGGKGWSRKSWCTSWCTPISQSAVKRSSRSRLTTVLETV